MIQCFVLDNEQTWCGSSCSADGRYAFAVCSTLQGHEHVQGLNRWLSLSDSPPTRSHAYTHAPSHSRGLASAGLSQSERDAPQLIKHLPWSRPAPVLRITEPSCASEITATVKMASRVRHPPRFLPWDTRGSDKHGQGEAWHKMSAEPLILRWHRGWC